MWLPVRRTRFKAGAAASWDQLESASALIAARSALRAM